jgi:cadmium resistance protein CadD (predicted permease)
MNSTLLVATASVTTFAATSIDDLVLLTFFFSQRTPARNIVFGQYLGFGSIIAATVIAISFALNLSHNWIRLLGILPIAVAIRHLIHASRGGNVQQRWKNFGVLRIALLIFSNGADNIGVYIPFFLLSRPHLSVVLAVYALLIAVWCMAAKWLGNHPIVLRQVDRRGHWLMPAVLIVLGCYVLSA